MQGKMITSVVDRNTQTNTLVEALTQSAKNNFVLAQTSKKKNDYISDETWQLIQKRDEEKNTEERTRLSKIIKKAAKKDSSLILTCLKKSQTKRKDGRT